MTNTLGTRVLMGIPTTRSARRSVRWIDAMANLQMPLGSSLGRVWIEDETIAEARNALCQAALDANAQYLFFLSDDVLPPANALLTLLDRIGREYPVGAGQVARASLVTGVYWTKTVPTEPYLWNGLIAGSYRDWLAGEFFPVDLAGCDCLLLEVDLLRSLPAPWFRTDWVWEPGQQPSSIATEDFYFFTTARERGYRLFADTSIQCAHEDRETGQLYALTTDMPQAGGTPEYDATERLIADLGSGTESPYFGDNCRVVRFDTRPDVRPDVRCDLRAIPEQHRGRFDVVHSRHVLEHFGRYETLALVTHWATLLKPGGELVIRVPSLDHAVGILGDPEASGYARQYAFQQIYGGQRYPDDYHKNGFTKRKLSGLLASVPGLGSVAVVEEDGGQNLKGSARLGHPAALEPVALASLWDRIAEREGALSHNGAHPSEPVPDALRRAIPVQAGQE